MGAHFFSLDLDQCMYLFVPQYILGKRHYEQLLECFNHILSGSKAKSGEVEQQKQSTSENAGDEEVETEISTTIDILSTSMSREGDEWPAMDAVRQHLLCVAQMLRAITPCPIVTSTTATAESTETTEGHEYLEQDPISPQEFLALMQVRVVILTLLVSIPQDCQFVYSSETWVNCFGVLGKKGLNTENVHSPLDSSLKHHPLHIYKEQRATALYCCLICFSNQFICL